MMKILPHNPGKNEIVGKTTKLFLLLIVEIFRIISGNPRQFNYRDESANCAYLHS